MDSSNFEIFNQITLHLLVRLFESFPNYVQVEARTLGFDAIEREDDESFEEGWELLELSKNSVSWLQAEGFIEVKGDVHSGSELEMRLTLKGLTLLGYAPPTMENSVYKTFAEEAQEALASGSKAAVADVVKSLFIRGVTLVPEVFS
ncbi:hypothetical protein ACMDCT_11665 [Halomonadaceae bacterium KBTZ08]